MINVLFVCSRNQWRSPTAEQVWRRHPELNVRSAGTSTNARHPVTENDLAWADVVFAMEDKHKSRLMAAHRAVLAGKVIHVLDIPDEFRYMDAELVAQLRHAVGDILGLEQD
ncbi:MAG: phosphotyrosine protein phosphatase [Massilia sp.]